MFDINQPSVFLVQLKPSITFFIKWKQTAKQLIKHTFVCTHNPGFQECDYMWNEFWERPITSHIDLKLCC